MHLLLFETKSLVSRCNNYSINYFSIFNKNLPQSHKHLALLYYRTDCVMYEGEGLREVMWGYSHSITESSTQNDEI